MLDKHLSPNRHIGSGQPPENLGQGSCFMKIKWQKSIYDHSNEERSL